MELIREVEAFEAKVKSLVEYDYGDFMRKSNLYLNRLLESFNTLSPEAREIFKSLKLDLQFSPERNIDLITERIFAKTKDLKKIIKQ